jgi:hypothetical protein
MVEFSSLQSSLKLRPDKSLTIGMMEYWDNGIMGFGEMRQRYIGKLGLTERLLNEKFPLQF